MYVPNNRAAKYVKQKLIKLKAGIDKFKIIIGDFTSPLSKVDRKTREKISKNIDELCNIINQ